MQGTQTSIRRETVLDPERLVASAAPPPTRIARPKPMRPSGAGGVPPAIVPAASGPSPVDGMFGPMFQTGHSRTHRLQADEAIIDFEARWPTGAQPVDPGGAALALCVAARTSGMQARTWVRTTRPMLIDFGAALAALAQGGTGEALLDGSTVPGSAVIVGRHKADGDAEITIVGHLADQRFGFRIEAFPLNHAALRDLNNWYAGLLGDAIAAAERREE